MNKSEKSRYWYKNLKLALQWNRDDIARNEIFCGDEEFRVSELNNLMELALIENRPSFVELLLENGLNLKSFLNVKRLLFLYNSHKLFEAAKKAPLFQLYKRRYLPKKNSMIITFEGIRRFLIDYLFEDFKPIFLPDVSDLELDQLEEFLVTFSFLKLITF